jgi:hypothetical protein
MRGFGGEHPTFTLVHRREGVAHPQTARRDGIHTLGSGEWPPFDHDLKRALHRFADDRNAHYAPLALRRRLQKKHNSKPSKPNARYSQ